MKVAIAVDGEQVSSHFDRCERYELVQVEDGRVVGRQGLPHPGHAPGRLPPYLKQAGADCIVAGGIGRPATALFEQLDLGVIVGVTGSVDDVVKALAEGKLESGESLCDH